MEHLLRLIILASRVWTVVGAMPAAASIIDADKWTMRLPATILRHEIISMHGFSSSHWSWMSLPDRVLLGLDVKRYVPLPDCQWSYLDWRGSRTLPELAIKQHGITLPS